MSCRIKIFILIFNLPNITTRKSGAWCSPILFSLSMASLKTSYLDQSVFVFESSPSLRLGRPDATFCRLIYEVQELPVLSKWKQERKKSPEQGCQKWIPDPPIKSQRGRSYAAPSSQSFDLSKLLFRHDEGYNLTAKCDNLH